MRPLLLVPYDAGSASPARLYEAAEVEDCDLLFLMLDSEHCRDMQPILEMFGAVVPSRASDSDEDVLHSLGGYQPDGVVTFCEALIPRAARLARRLGLAYHGESDIAAITRKDAQRERLRAAGLTSIRVASVTRRAEAAEAIEIVGLPAIVKPILGAASRDTVLVTDRREYWRVASRLMNAAVVCPYIVEQFLQGRTTPAPWGDYIAVDCIADADDVRPVFTTSKFALAEPFRERGGYGPMSVVDEQTVADSQALACQAVRSLGIRHGLADVELKLTEAGPQLIEVNGRLGGWVDDLASRSGSAAPLAMAVRAALGRPAVTSARTPANKIAFHYLVMPPRAALRVARIYRSEMLRTIAGVDTVVLHKGPGAVTDWRTGTVSSVAAISGSASSIGDLQEAINAIDTLDWIEYD